MTTSANTPEGKTDAYLEQLLNDLAKAEEYLRHEIAQYDNPYNKDPEANMRRGQANVDRLHKIIDEYKKKSP